MTGTIEELISIKEESLELLSTLTNEELSLFNNYLIELLSGVNKEMRNRL
jgi:hypothetical protein